MKNKKARACCVAIYKWTPRSRHFYCYVETMGRKKYKMRSSKFLNYVFACDWVEEKVRKILKTNKYWYTEGVVIRSFTDREQE